MLLQTLGDGTVCALFMLIISFTRDTSHYLLLHSLHYSMPELLHLLFIYFTYLLITLLIIITYYFTFIIIITLSQLGNNVSSPPVVS